jgi:DNA repair protein RecO (recombination protein O)
MIVSTRGFVLYQADYSETSLIVKIFTEHFGMQSYIVKGVRKKGSKVKRNLFEPLSMLELVAYQKENAGMHILRDVSCYRQFNSIPGNIVKSSVLLFMNELLYRSIPGEMPDKRIFRFLEESLEELDSKDTHIALFPLVFSIQLADLLGFRPQNNYSAQEPVFDMQEGMFCHRIPDHLNFLVDPMSGFLSDLLDADLQRLSMLDHAYRTQLLERVLEYFRLHLSSFGVMKSLQVLGVVLRD